MKTYLVMMPVKISYKVVQVVIPSPSEEMAFDLATESVKSGKYLENFEIDLLNPSNEIKCISQNLLKLGGPVHESEVKQKSVAWMESMKENGHF